ncbi:MAG TPA: hypothetical protein PKD10_19060 [Paracoccaceae bacterium]|nr:hypothetical protein [Paracoccaceae bacterium]
MSKRFENLKKVPPEPAAKLLATANTKLQTKLALPASASVTAVLDALDGQGAKIDVLRMLSVALPPREATWWACLAARDIVGADAKQVPPPLATAERWVFKPTTENRAAASDAFHHAEQDDDTVYCAMAALYADGTLGLGDTANYPAPPNGVSAAVFAMNLIALRANAERMALFLELLIDRGVDIARGGNGRVEAGSASKPETAEAKG